MSVGVVDGEVVFLVVFLVVFMIGLLVGRRVGRFVVCLIGVRVGGVAFKSIVSSSKAANVFLWPLSMRNCWINVNTSLSLDGSLAAESGAKGRMLTSCCCCCSFADDTVVVVV